MHQWIVALKEMNIPTQKMTIEQSMGWIWQVAHMKSLHKDWTHLSMSQIKSNDWELKVICSIEMRWHNAPENMYKNICISFFVV
jgi:hypothetical protein